MIDVLVVCLHNFDVAFMSAWSNSDYISVYCNW